MGNKVNPTALRLGVNKTWSSLWYAERKQYTKSLQEDLKIKDYLRKKLRIAGLDRIEINRSANNITVSVYVARPGVAIGRGGEGIDLIKKDLSRKFGENFDIRINEIKKPDLSARVIARSIADGLEKRQNPKKLMMEAREKVKQAGAAGVKITISGRIGGAEQARSISAQSGPVPRQTIRADIDYAKEAGKTPNAGIMGVKVWIYRSEPEDSESKKK